jgi:hypothetical protein
MDSQSVKFLLGVGLAACILLLSYGLSWILHIDFLHFAVWAGTVGTIALAGYCLWWAFFRRK